VREFEENGVGDVVASHSQDGVVSSDNSRALAESIAKNAAPNGGVGLAMIGPFEDNTTFMAVHSPDIQTCIESRRFQKSDHISRWLVIQGLDIVRRSILGELESPADWR
jgi:hypothetical protein